MIFSTKLLGSLLGGSLLLSVVLGAGWAVSDHRLSNAKEVIEGLTEWQDGVREATRLAAGSDQEVTPAQVQPMIQQLGNLRVQLIAAVEAQNNAVEVLQRETEAAQEVARQAERQRRGAIERAEALQARLRERAGTPAPDTDAAVRQTQDELYEAGL